MNIAAEHMYRVQEQLLAAHEYIPMTKSFREPSSPKREDSMNLAISMCGADALTQHVPIYIDDAMLELVQAAFKTFPRDTVWGPEMMMFPLGLISARSPMITLSGDRPISAAQWFTDDQIDHCIYLNWAEVPRRHLPPRYTVHVPPLWPFLMGTMDKGESPSQWRAQNEAEEEALGDHQQFGLFLMTVWTLLNQRIAVKETYEPSRAHRRRAEKEGKDTPSTVTVIRLRRPSRDNGAEADSSPIDWTHRWVVNGFWRNQYHPSTDSHKPTWIAPYIKGPDDKPLILKDRIYTFVR
jgi:hypothetical protein